MHARVSGNSVHRVDGFSSSVCASEATRTRPRPGFTTRVGRFHVLGGGFSQLRSYKNPRPAVLLLKAWPVSTFLGRVLGFLLNFN